MNSPTILQAIRDKDLLGYGIRDLKTFEAWLVAIAAMFGLPMTKHQRTTYRELTHRNRVPKKQFRRCLMICGRRSGKSYVQALIAVYLACFRDYTPFLAPGERATIAIVASDRNQARNILRYIAGFLQAPLLKGRVLNENAESFELEGNITIEVQTCSFRALRGYTYAAVLCDEMAAWVDSDTGANPASEVLTAILPGLKTIPGSMLIISTTPLGRRGIVGELYDKHFGKDDKDYLVLQAPSLRMNPTLNAEDIESDIALDPVRMRAEYEATFRNDTDALLSHEVITRATMLDIAELAPNEANVYIAALDASSGSGQDSFTLSISFRDQDDHGFLALCREARPPFDPELVCQEYADIIGQYNCLNVFADRWSLVWVQQAFERAGHVQVEDCEMDRSQIYGRAVPLFNAGRVSILDNKRLRDQLLGLIRWPSRTKELIDHAPLAHDDLSNSACLALVKACDVTAIDYWRWMGSPQGIAQHQTNMLRQQIRSGNRW
jgi:hypothetical protein